MEFIFSCSIRICLNPVLRMKRLVCYSAYIKIWTFYFCFSECHTLISESCIKWLPCLASQICWSNYLPLQEALERSLPSPTSVMNWSETLSGRLCFSPRIIKEAWIRSLDWSPNAWKRSRGNLFIKLLYMMLEYYCTSWTIYLWVSQMIQELEFDIHSFFIWFRGRCTVVFNTRRSHKGRVLYIDQGQDQHSYCGGDNTGQQAN